MLIQICVFFRDQNSNYGGEISPRKEEKLENQFSSKEKFSMETLKEETGLKPIKKFYFLNHLFSKSAF